MTDQILEAAEEVRQERAREMQKMEEVGAMEDSVSTTTGLRRLGRLLVPSLGGERG